MKLNLISHNVRGFNDPGSFAKERYFLDTLNPRTYVVLIQEHKLRRRALENLGNKLMHGCTSWTLEAAREKRVGLIPTRPKNEEWISSFLANMLDWLKTMGHSTTIELCG